MKKCGNRTHRSHVHAACEHESEFTNVSSPELSRRGALAGGLSLAAMTFLGESFKPIARAEEPASSSLMGFKPVMRQRARGPWPVISEDYEFQVFHPWGDPISPDGPAFKPPVSPADQAEQIGIGHDGMYFFPIGSSSSHGLLVLNHEFGRNSVVIGKDVPASLAEVRASQHAHGVSVTAIQKSDGVWRTVASKYARRVHTNTPVVFSGPAADSEHLKTPSETLPRGTVNNCANGKTPWNTYLTCEENFNGYFGVSGASEWEASPQQDRYGFTQAGFGFDWHLHDMRFDLGSTDHRNEENRFGWVVEIDPFDVSQVPVKRTALGRFKHEGAAIVEGAGGRIVAYMGDDSSNEYIYKYVSSGNWQEMRSRGVSPLDEGQLYVANFAEDGTGRWLALDINRPELRSKFKSQAEVQVFARLAADAVGATPMDRPEWTVVAPDGAVYCTLTNNRSRAVPNAFNPTAPNLFGHIVRWRDSDDHLGNSFKWDLFKVCRGTIGSETAFGSPDGLWADPDGRLFIATDGSQTEGMNNQLLVADTHTGEVRRLFSAVPGGEVTGFAVTPDRTTLFVNIQHPGDGDLARTDFPRLGASRVLRDATIAIRRKDGGTVGS